MTLETVRQFVRERLHPLEQRLRGLVVRGAVKVLDDAGGLQVVQVAGVADELIDGAEVLTPPGFTSRPATAEALVFAVQGNPAHRVALLFDRTKRLKGDLAAGEAALFIGRAGQLVKLKTDGSVEVKAKGDNFGTDSSIILKQNGDVVITPGVASKVLLGDAGATLKAAIAEAVQGRLDALSAAISAWVPVPMDGGAALKAALATWLAASNAVGSSNVYVKGP